MDFEKMLQGTINSIQQSAVTFSKMLPLRSMEIANIPEQDIPVASKNSSGEILHHFHGGLIVPGGVKTSCPSI